MNVNNWIYNGKELTEPIEDMEGFVYKITHIPSGQYYIGKKSFWTRRNKKIGKRETQRLKDEKKENGEKNWWIVPKKKLVVKESKWKSYFSSNEWIQEKVDEEGMEMEFKREIIQMYPTKKTLTYGEVEHQVKMDCLKDDNCINNTILGKFFKKDFNTNTTQSVTSVV